MAFQGVMNAAFEPRWSTAVFNMNIFRASGDLIHAVSIVLLIVNMGLQRSSNGVSFKTQCLYAIVFTTRYLGNDLCSKLMLDLFWAWLSWYNFLMKIFFISSSLCILFLMKVPFKPTQDSNIDTFKIEYLLVGSLIVSLVWNYNFELSEVSVFDSCR
jgi:ER lumen protein retaining receptor